MPSCPVPDVPILLRRRFVLQSEIRSCIGVETTSERVSGQCVGWAQGLSLGTKVVQTCESVIAMPLSRQNHVRLAEVEEQLPWHDLYDSLRETDEQTYFDLSPPGVSRDPQHGGPSTSSDVPMKPIPVPDEFMPDAIADEPDTSEIPVLPNSIYAPVCNPRVRWRSDALEHPTPEPVLPPVVSLQNVLAATPSWSPPLPVTCETPSMQQPVTPHVEMQSEFPPPAPTAHVDDTPPWVFQEPETPRISTRQDTPVTIPQQGPLPPIQVFFVTGGDERVHW